MQYFKSVCGVNWVKRQRRRFRATHILLLKIAIICFAAGVTICYSTNVIVGVVASMVAGCAVEVIDAHFEKHDDKRLDKIEQELDKLRQNKSRNLF